jgi:hypothetical protein
MEPFPCASSQAASLTSTLHFFLDSVLLRGSRKVCGQTLVAAACHLSSTMASRDSWRQCSFGPQPGASGVMWHVWCCLTELPPFSAAGGSQAQIPLAEGTWGLAQGKLGSTSASLWRAWRKPGRQSPGSHSCLLELRGFPEALASCGGA